MLRREKGVAYSRNVEKARSNHMRRFSSAVGAFETFGGLETRLGVSEGQCESLL